MELRENPGELESCRERSRQGRVWEQPLRERVRSWSTEVGGECVRVK